MRASERESSCSWASFWASFHFWSFLVAFDLRMGRRFGRPRFWSFLVAFGRRMGRRFVLVVFGRFWASYGASFCFGRFWSLLML